MKKQRLRSYIFLLINVAVWGVALTFVKPALAITTPFRYLLYRFLFAGIFSLPIIIHFWKHIGHKLRTLTTIALIELIGTTVTLSLLYFGLRLTTSVEANLINNTAPIFVLLLGMFLLHEHEERHEILGLILSFGCTVLITLLPILRTGSLPQNFSFLGNILVLASNVTAGLYYVLAKKYYHHLPKFFCSSVSYFVGIITFFLLSLSELGSSLPHFLTAVSIDAHSPTVWFAALYMATFGSIIGLTCYFIGQDGIEASEASIIGYLSPIISLPTAVLFLGEKVEPIQVLLLLGVLAGVYVSERRIQKKKKLLFKNLRQRSVRLLSA